MSGARQVLAWEGIGTVTVDALNGAPVPGGWRLGDPGALVAAWEFSWPRMERYAGLFKWLKLERWYSGQAGTPGASREHVEAWPEHVVALAPDDTELTDGAAAAGAFHEADVPRLRFGFDFPIEHVLWNPLKYGGVLVVVRDPGRDGRRSTYQTIRQEGRITKQVGMTCCPADALKKGGTIELRIEPGSSPEGVAEIVRQNLVGIQEDLEILRATEKKP